VRKLKKEVWPFQITIKTTNEGIDKWCEENLGKRFQEWYGYYTTHEERIFAFKDEATLLVFKLRWSYNG
jgi:hypothetical protein